MPVIMVKRRFHHPDHSCRIMAGITSLLDCDLLLDCSILCDGQVLRAHKVILAAGSDYFRTAFSALASTSPCHETAIIIRDMAFRDLKVLIDFMYMGDVSVDPNRIPQVAKSAEFLQVHGFLSSLQFEKDPDMFLKDQIQEESTDIIEVERNGRESSSMTHIIPRTPMPVKQKLLLQESFTSSPIICQALTSDNKMQQQASSPGVIIRDHGQVRNHVPIHSSPMTPPSRSMQLMGKTSQHLQPHPFHPFSQPSAEEDGERMRRKNASFFQAAGNVDKKGEGTVLRENNSAPDISNHNNYGHVDHKRKLSEPDNCVTHDGRSSDVFSSLLRRSSAASDSQLGQQSSSSSQVSPKQSFKPRDFFANGIKLNGSFLPDVRQTGDAGSARSTSSSPPPLIQVRDRERVPSSSSSSSATGINNHAFPTNIHYSHSPGSFESLSAPRSPYSLDEVDLASFKRGRGRPSRHSLEEDFRQTGIVHETGFHEGMRNGVKSDDRYFVRSPGSDFRESTIKRIRVSSDGSTASMRGRRPKLVGTREVHGKNKCPHCPQVYYSTQAMNDHINNVHSKNSAKYNCKLCDKEFSWKISLNKHLRKQHGQSTIHHNHQNNHHLLDNSNNSVMSYSMDALNSMAATHPRIIISTVNGSPQLPLVKSISPSVPDDHNHDHHHQLPPSPVPANGTAATSSPPPSSLPSPC